MSRQVQTPQLICLGIGDGEKCFNNIVTWILAPPESLSPMTGAPTSMAWSITCRNTTNGSKGSKLRDTTSQKLLGSLTLLLSTPGANSCFYRQVSYSRCKQKMMSYRGQASWAKMVTWGPHYKLKQIGCLWSKYFYAIRYLIQFTPGGHTGGYVKRLCSRLRAFADRNKQQKSREYLLTFYVRLKYVQKYF